MENVITLDANNIGSFLGPIASTYSYTPELRKRVDELYIAATRSSNRYFVLEGTILKAAQSTKRGALQYMADGLVLVEVQLIGCGRMTHVEGTNGGTMPCGAKFNGEPYYCAQCVANANGEKPMSSFSEQLASELANNPQRLLARLREAVSVLNPRYDKFFQRKDQRFDFEQKRLYGHSGFYMQWSLRPDPTAPESYENQQTSVGCVSLDRVTTA